MKRVRLFFMLLLHLFWKLEMISESFIKNTLRKYQCPGPDPGPFSQPLPGLGILSPFPLRSLQHMCSAVNQSCSTSATIHMEMIVVFHLQTQPGPGSANISVAVENGFRASRPAIQFSSKLALLQSALLCPSSF